MRIRLHREAGGELDAATAWYEEQEAGLGGDLLIEMDRAIATIAASPTAWPLVRRKTGLRRFLLARFPYAPLYEHLEDELRILAVAHTRRRPGYWRRRRFRDVPPPNEMAGSRRRCAPSASEGRGRRQSAG